ncbi:hypothetical protein BC629DRAFT_265331 [Irpex lacteus]|nr:hypothetical protein BC629DRAFT_265331 [Irpex lacteus]
MRSQVQVLIMFAFMTTFSLSKAAAFPVRTRTNHEAGLASISFHRTVISLSAQVDHHTIVSRHCLPLVRLELGISQGGRRGISWS